MIVDSLLIDDCRWLCVRRARFWGRVDCYRNASAATLRLVERFTPTSLEQIEWSVTVEDPSTWTRPWTFSMPLTKTQTEPVLEFACHEGNYAVGHILSGARAAESAKHP